VVGVDLTSLVVYSKLIVERNSGCTSGFPVEYHEVSFPDLHEQY